MSPCSDRSATSTLDAYVSDYPLVVAGVFAGNVLLVALAALFEADLLRYLGIARAMPDFLPPVRSPLVANPLAAV